MCISSLFAGDSGNKKGNCPAWPPQEEKTQAESRMNRTNGTSYVSQDSRNAEFSRTVQKDGIPARRYEEGNWKRWISDQWVKVLNIRKN